VGREKVMFFGTQLSNLYTAVDSPAKAAKCMCYIVFECVYLGS
jgi:hypothetical protein